MSTIDIRFTTNSFTIEINGGGMRNCALHSVHLGFNLLDTNSLYLSSRKGKAQNQGIIRHNKKNPQNVDIRIDMSVDTLIVDGVEQDNAPNAIALLQIGLFEGATTP